MVLIGAVLMSCSSGNAQQTAGKITNEELVQLMAKDNLQILDVRTPKETSFGVIPGATIIDYYDLAFADKVGRLDKEKPLVIYCAAGGRSAQATEKLTGMGFKEIYDLSSGFRGWEGAGNPIQK